MFLLLYFNFTKKFNSLTTRIIKRKSRHLTLFKKAFVGGFLC
ncbi:hypothetical protein HPHPP1_1287 [Helicobacter pylori Hp P-1]|nr:hypothetical protein HPHPP1_1287 [Helicobacter pylori Hp P-1]EJC19318.1 hypothetical protein HPHPP1B_1369 [Helicobacter pylori Hp P-1b]